MDNEVPANSYKCEQVLGKMTVLAKFCNVYLPSYHTNIHSNGSFQTVTVPKTLPYLDYVMSIGVGMKQPLSLCMGVI